MKASDGTKKIIKNYLREHFGNPKTQSIFKMKNPKDINDFSFIGYNNNYDRFYLSKEWFKYNFENTNYQFYKDVLKTDLEVSKCPKEAVGKHKDILVEVKDRGPRLKYLQEKFVLVPFYLCLVLFITLLVN